MKSVQTTLICQDRLPDSRAIAARFSAAAATYDSAAGIQRAAAARLIQMLANEAVPKRLLEFGCGTGILTERLAALWPATPIDALDISAAMIGQARRHLSDNSRIRWLARDFMRFSPTTAYPMLVSSCSLHWMIPIAAVLKRCASLLAEGGHLCFAVMLAGTLNELHQTRRRVAPHKSPRIQLPRKSEIEAALRAAGFRVLSKKQEQQRIRYSSARALVRALHDQGVTHPGHAVLQRRELHSLFAEYDRKFTEEGEIYASYVTGYFTAVKASGAR